MSRYLMKYVGTYRVIAEYNLATNDYPRICSGCDAGQLDSSFEDLYIKCKSGIKVYHYGKSILVAYIPSLGRGHNIIKDIYNDRIGKIELIENNYDAIYKTLNADRFIFDLEDTDKEVLFKFNAKNIESIMQYLKPSVSGANKSPFAKSNLRKRKYEIPYTDLMLYKEITAVISKDDISLYSKINDVFLKNISTKKHTYNDIKSEIKLSGLAIRDYIHSVQKWEEYLDFIKKYLEQNYQPQGEKA